MTAQILSTQRTAGANGSPPSMAERAYRVIRDRLITLEIAPGEPINEHAISLELGFGRTPVRESLKRLEVDHLVVSYPRRGTFATRVDLTDLATVSEVRMVLEPLAARRAAQVARPEQRALLAAKADQIAAMDLDDVTNPDLMQHDIDVHRMIYAAAGNPHLEETLVRLDNLATRIWCLVLDRLPAIGVHVHEHVELLRAVVDGDGDRAAELGLEHTQHFEQSIRQVL